MSLKSHLTNEKLNKKFGNPFALVNHAIILAKSRVLRGESLDTNPANDVMELLEDELENEDENAG